MKLIKTPSFELAVYKQGDEKADKLVLCLPGRLDTKDYAHMRSHVDFLAGKGYLALSFDPPGTWESSGDISFYTTQNYLKAVDELIRHYGNRPTIVIGHSRGGSMAMLAGINNKYVTHFVAVMSHYGPSFKPKESGDVSISYRDLPPGTEKTKERKQFNLPMSYFDDPTPYTGLERCANPKLFFLGKEDKTVLPEDVMESYELAAEPKQLCELDSNHDYRYHPTTIKEVETVINKFLEAN